MASNSKKSSGMPDGAAALIAAISAIGDTSKWAREDPDIDYAGKKITLPADPSQMPLREAIIALERKAADEEELTTVNENILAYPLEAAVAFVQAMESIYGWASPVPTPGFFGPTPPHFLSVQTDVDTWVQVPWGSFKLPGVENPVQISAGRDPNGHLCLQVSGEVRKRERKVLLELAAKTRDILRTSSIYRNKAIHLTTDYDGDLDIDKPPTFLDLRQVRPEELILNRDVEAQFRTNIFAPILFTDKVRKAEIPLKRGVLLSGKYGVGKTMATHATAKLCRDNGWTFIAVDRAASLREALLFAQRYQPAVVFVEDIDRETSERDDDTNDLMNTIDGILGKNVEVMVVMTTNHVERIEPAMLRPGRLDAVITVQPPDEDAVGRLIRLYSRGLLRDGEDLASVGRALAGNIPAVIREVVERSKLAMIANDHDELTEDDLLISAYGMRDHLALLTQKADEPSAAERLGAALGEVLRNALTGDELDDMSSSVTHAAEHVESVVRDVRDRLVDQQRMSSTIGKMQVETGEKVTEIHKRVVGSPSATF